MISATSTEKLVVRDDKSEPCYDSLQKATTDHQELQENSRGVYDNLQELQNSNGFCGYDVPVPVTNNEDLNAEPNEYKAFQPSATDMQAK